MRTVHITSAVVLVMIFFASTVQTQNRTNRQENKRPTDPYNKGYHIAEVRTYNGAPTFFLDGKPEFYGSWWVSPPTNEGWNASATIKKYSPETNIHIYAFDVGPTEWCGPAPGRTSHFDFSTVEARFNRILEADPKALFHLRIYLEMTEPQSRWWQELYPDECEILSDGTPHRQSFASTVWREQTKNFLREFIFHLKKLGLSRRVVSYQVGAGHTGEWVKGKLSMFYLTGDYSKPMKLHFQTWLRNRYKNDVTLLKKAWNDPQATYETAVVPSGPLQFETKNMTFRDPMQEQKVIDY